MTVVGWVDVFTREGLVLEYEMCFNCTAGLQIQRSGGHAFQFMEALKGGSYLKKYTENQLLIEREAYIRQYFSAPATLKMPVNSYREIDANYLQQFKTKDGILVYPNIK